MYTSFTTPPECLDIQWTLALNKKPFYHLWLFSPWRPHRRCHAGAHAHVGGGSAQRRQLRNGEAEGAAAAVQGIVEVDHVAAEPAVEPELGVDHPPHPLHQLGAVVPAINQSIKHSTKE